MWVMVSHEKLYTTRKHCVAYMTLLMSNEFNLASDE